MTALSGYVSHTHYGDGNSVVVVADGASDARSYLDGLPAADRGGADEWARLLKVGGNGYMCGPTAWKTVSGQLVTPSQSNGGDRDPDERTNETFELGNTGIEYTRPVGSTGGSLKGC